MVGHELAQDRDHDDRGRQVVQNRRQKERENPNDPKQRHLALGPYVTGDQRETFMGIDQFHNGHRTDEEKQNPCRLGKQIAKLPVDQKMKLRIESTFDLCTPVHGIPFLEGLARDERPIVHRIKGPAKHSGEDSRGGFVDVDLMFQGDGQVPQHEQNNDGR